MITNVGGLGTAHDYSTTRTISVAISRDVAVGAVLVVWHAQDSVFSVFSPTSGWNFARCIDDRGNVYSNIGSVTDQRSFFRVGAMTHLYITRVQYALTAGDHITVQMTGEPGVNWASAISVEEFDFGEGNTWAVDQNFTFRRDLGTDPASLGHNTPTDREWLYVHGIATEGPITDSFTWTANFTPITFDGTNTGTVTNDMSIRGGWRIHESTSEGVNVTNNTSATRDSTQVMRAVCAVPVSTFPQTPLLDDFNRANEAPLSGGGNWHPTDDAWFGDLLSLDTNRVKGSGGSVWDHQMEGNCAEAYCDIPVFGDCALHIFSTGDGGNVTFDGEGARWQVLSLVWPAILLGRSGNAGGIGTPKLYSWVAGVNGYKLGVQRTRFTEHGARAVWRSWIHRGTSWEQVAQFIAHPAEDGLETGPGRLALALAGGTGRADNFGGGVFSCPGRRFRADYYRRRS